MMSWISDTILLSDFGNRMAATSWGCWMTESAGLLVRVGWGELANPNIDSNGPMFSMPLLGFVPHPNLRAESRVVPTAAVIGLLTDTTRMFS